MAVIYSFEERQVGYDGGRGGLCEDTGSQEEDRMEVHDAYTGSRIFVMSRTVMHNKKDELAPECAVCEEMMMEHKKSPLVGIYRLKRRLTSTKAVNIHHQCQHAGAEAKQSLFSICSSAPWLQRISERPLLLSQPYQL